jgi:hypothetical protein
MIRTKKRIDVSGISNKNSEDAMQFLELQITNIVTNDLTNIVRIRFSETPFTYVEAMRQLIIDGNPQFNADGTEKTETFHKVVKSSVYPKQERWTDYDYKEYFLIRKAIELKLPKDLSEMAKYKLVNQIGLKNIIVSEGFYKSQFSMTDFE